MGYDILYVTVPGVSQLHVQKTIIPNLHIYIRAWDPALFRMIRGSRRWGGDSMGLVF